MTYGKVVLKDGGSDALFPELALDEIRERITGGPYYDLARECYLWMDASEHEVKSATIAARLRESIRSSRSPPHATASAGRTMQSR